jgi:hypothetical protein
MRPHPHGVFGVWNSRIGKGDVRFVGISARRGHRHRLGERSREKSEIPSPPLPSPPLPAPPEKAVRGNGHDHESANQQSTAPYPILHRRLADLIGRPRLPRSVPQVEVWPCTNTVIQYSCTTVTTTGFCFFLVHPSADNTVEINMTYLMPHLLGSMIRGLNLRL